MRKKQWIILVIALAAIVAASAGLNGYQKKQDQKAAQQEEDEKVYALQFTSDDVTGISYEYSGETLEFTKKTRTAPEFSLMKTKKIPMFLLSLMQIK